jgi:hypothetical protein
MKLIKKRMFRDKKIEREGKSIFSRVNLFLINNQMRLKMKMSTATKT